MLPASRSWGFRGGLALSHIPLQEAGWGSLCRTGLSYSGVSVCPPVLGAWGRKRQETGHSPRQTQLLLGVQT